MTEKEKVLKKVLWLDIEILEDDFDEVEVTITEIRKYIKKGGEQK